PVTATRTGACALPSFSPYPVPSSSTVDFRDAASQVGTVSKAASTAVSRSAAVSAPMALSQAAWSTAGRRRNRKSTYGTISESTASRVWASGATAANAFGSKSFGAHGGAGMVAVPVSHGPHASTKDSADSALMY